MQMKSPDAKTVAELLEMAEAFCVPAFQRGQVWDSGAVGRLLDSLSHGYFIGALLLWETSPQHPWVDEHLYRHARRQKPVTHLVVDGQQRLRGLIEALIVGGRLQAEGGSGRLWCLRMTPRPGSDDLVPEFRLQRFTKTGKIRHPHPELLPLVLLRPLAERREEGLTYAWQDDGRSCQRTFWSIEQWCEEFGPKARKYIEEASKVIEGLLANRINVQELPRQWSKSRVLANYKRLNETGIKLTSDEQEYARLVEATESQVDDALKALYRIRPGANLVVLEDSADVPNEIERGDWLKRGEHREFGLGMLIRAVRLARDYHENHTRETGRFLPDPPAERPKHDQWRRDLKEWVRDARSSLCALSEALTVLGVDDRRRIPSRFIRRAAPLFFLLYRYRELKTDPGFIRNVLPRLILGIALQPYHESKGVVSTQVLTQYVLSSGTPLEAVRGLLDETPVKLGLVHEEVLATRRLQDPYVDLFYWRLRWKKAPDLPHDDPECPRALCGAIHPERQHIVPISRVRYPDGVKEPSRAVAHAVNSLGNLTFISSVANGLGGWRDNFMDMAPKHEVAHLLEGTGESSYRGIKPRPGEKKIPVSHLESFVEARSAKIAQDLFVWERSFPDPEMHIPKCEPKARPASLLDTLLGWGYPYDISLELDRRLRGTWVYAKKTSSRYWKSSGSNRIRWKSDGGWDALRMNRGLVFEIRLADEAETWGSLSLKPDGIYFVSEGQTEPQPFRPAEIVADGQVKALLRSTIERLLPRVQTDRNS